MKILHVDPKPPENLGGAEIFVKNLIINLKTRKNIDCDYLTTNILDKTKRYGTLNNDTNVFYKKCYFNLWSKNPITNFLSFLNKNLNNYDIIHVHSYILLTSLQCALLRKIKNFPYLLHIHGGIDTPPSLGSSTFEDFQLKFKNSVFDRSIGKFIIESADGLISVSKKDLMLIKKNYRITENNFYIPNAIDLNKFKREKDVERVFITYIGRLSYIKGIDIFLEIIKKISDYNKNFKFLIIGRGALTELVLKAQKSYPITYYPFFPYERIQEIYNQSKMVFLTSRFEGLPTILLESLACETPVVGSNVGGVSEVVRSNYNGVLFNINRYTDSIKDILSLLTDDSKLKEYGKNGRKLIEKEYSWEAVTDNIEKVYKRLINRNNILF